MESLVSYLPAKDGKGKFLTFWLYYWAWFCSVSEVYFEKNKPMTLSSQHSFTLATLIIELIRKWKGGIAEGGNERIVLCFSLIKETFRFHSAICSWTDGSCNTFADFPNLGFKKGAAKLLWAGGVRSATICELKSQVRAARLKPTYFYIKTNY